jgi:hypothetical protein
VGSIVGFVVFDRWGVLNEGIVDIERLDVIN